MKSLFVSVVLPFYWKNKMLEEQTEWSSCGSGANTKQKKAAIPIAKVVAVSWSLWRSFPFRAHELANAHIFKCQSSSHEKWGLHRRPATLVLLGPIVAVKKQV